MKKHYQTQQRKILLDFLKNSKNKQYTIHELSQLLAEHDIGKSTLYRLIKELVEEGAVNRTSVGNSRHFVYQYYGHTDCHLHMHLQCSTCGKLIHLSSSYSQQMQKLLNSSEDFEIDSGSILTGRCKKCKSKTVGGVTI